MRSKNTRRRVTGVVALGAAVLLVGMAHAPFARPLLMRFGGCPMAGGHMTAIESEAARHMALGGDRPAARSAVRPALGFDLDRSTAHDVWVWADRARIDCDGVRDGLIRCAHVPPGALGRPVSEGTLDELELEFDTHERLVNLTTYRTHLTAQSASVCARTIVSSLHEALGPPERAAGGFDVALLTAPSAESISTVAYRFADYVAEVTAMNAPSGGPSVREHYMSARD